VPVRRLTEGVPVTLPSPTVLVVDDASWVRNVLSGGLPHYGFNVVLAENGRQALELCQQAGAIRAALVDKRLPDMGSLELLTALRELNPEIRCALMSGDADHSADEELPGLGKVFVFCKPFRLDDVGLVLWQLLGETGPQAVGTEGDSIG
jgi:CheY-like chemotaxis protein